MSPRGGNKRRIKRFIEALESGKYRQIPSSLRIEDRYCAMGVACDVSGVGQWVNKNVAYAYESDSEWDSQLLAPGEVIDYYGFRDSTVDYIMEMNDSQNLTFKDIAARLRDLYGIKE